MKEYGPIHTLWSASEEDIAESLKGVAGCIDRCCRATEKRMAGLSEHLLPVLHEYVLYTEILMVRFPEGLFMAQYKIWLSPVTMSRREFVAAEDDFTVPVFTQYEACTACMITVCYQGILLVLFLLLVRQELPLPNRKSLIVLPVRQPWVAVLGCLVLPSSVSSAL